MDSRLRTLERGVHEGSVPAMQYLREIVRSGGAVEGALAKFCEKLIQRDLSQDHLNMIRTHVANAGSADLRSLGYDKKTPVIETLNLLFAAGLASSCLIIAPRTLIDDWVFRLNGESELRVGVVAGGGRSKIKVLRSDAQVFVATYGSLSSGGPVLAELQAKKWSILVGDEAHLFKSRYAKRTQVLLKLAEKTPYRIALSSRYVRRLEELWTLGKFINSELFGKRYIDFLRKYFHSTTHSCRNHPRRYTEWAPKPDAARLINEELHKHTGIYINGL